MSLGAGSIVALVSECQPAEALAIASPWIPQGWSATTIKTAWGAALMAGPAVLCEDHVVAIGTAVADPWGLPGEPFDRHVLLDRFARYGDQVAQLAAGPFAVADLVRGTLIAALNGIIPIYLSRGARVVIGSHPKIVTALAGSTSSVSVPPGSSASVEGNIANIAWFGVWESLPLMTLRALEAEVEDHIGSAGPSREVKRGVFAEPSGQLLVRWLGSALVVSPRFRSLRTSMQASAELETLRRRVGELWWEAGLGNAFLFVPAFERPALDSLTLTVQTA